MIVAQAVEQVGEGSLVGPPHPRASVGAPCVAPDCAVRRAVIDRVAHRGEGLVDAGGGAADRDRRARAVAEGLEERAGRVVVEVRASPARRSGPRSLATGPSLDGERPRDRADAAGRRLDGVPSRRSAPDTAMPYRRLPATGSPAASSLAAASAVVAKRPSRRPSRSPRRAMRFHSSAPPSARQPMASAMAPCSSTLRRPAGCGAPGSATRLPHRVPRASTGTMSQSVSLRRAARARRADRRSQSASSLRVGAVDHLGGDHLVREVLQDHGGGERARQLGDHVVGRRAAQGERGEALAHVGVCAQRLHLAADDAPVDRLGEVHKAHLAPQDDEAEVRRERRPRPWPSGARSKRLPSSKTMPAMPAALSPSTKDARAPSASGQPCPVESKSSPPAKKRATSALSEACTHRTLLPSAACPAITSGSPATNAGSAMASATVGSASSAACCPGVASPVRTNCPDGGNIATIGGGHASILCAILGISADSRHQAMCPACFMKGKPWAFFAITSRARSSARPSAPAPSPTPRRAPWWARSPTRRPRRRTP